MLSKIRLFPITSWGSDGYPVLGTPSHLITLEEGETEVNDIKLKISHTVKSKTLNGDDKEEVHKSIVGYTGEIEAYGIDSTALALINEVNKDSNGNINHLAGTGAEKYVCVFMEGKNEKGKKFQKWFYKVKFDPIDDELETQTENTTTITLPFTGEIITASNKDRTHATVYQGNTGWVNGEPTAQDIYKEPAGV